MTLSLRCRPAPTDALVPLGLAALATIALVGLTQTEWGPLVHHAGHPTDPAPALTALVWMVGWSLMATALMLPAATPLIARTVQGRGFLATGFLGVWLAAGLAALMIALASRQPGGAAIASLLLLVAGAYQLSPAKRRALIQCRAHVRRVVTVGSDPTGEALRRGLHHGVLSLRCCGPLMAAAAVAPLGGVAGMLALGALAVAEEAAPGGARLRIPLGLAVIAIGVAGLG
jgi:predicted metal-binding membrane protein